MADAQLKAVITAEDRASKVIANVGSSLEQTKSKLDKFIPSFKTIATAGAVVGGALALLGKNAISSAADYEQAQISFKTMLGSADKANKLLKDLTEFGKKTPFELPGLIEASKKLIAFGTAQENLIPTLRQLGDIAAGVGIPVNELAELYGKAQVQGRLFAEDVNQLTGRGIPVIQEFAKQFGVSESKVRELVETGKIGFPELQKAFANLTGEGSKFGGLMDAQSSSFSGMLSNLKDGISEMMRQLGAVLLPYAKGVLEELNKIIAEIPGWVENVINQMKEKIEQGKQAWQELSDKVNGFIEKAKENQAVITIVDELKAAFDRVWNAVVQQLYPALQELWNTVQTQLFPALQQLWEALKPMAPYFEFWAKILLAVFIGVVVELIEKFAKVIEQSVLLITAVTKLVNYLVQEGSKKISSFTDEVRAIATAFSSVVDWIQKAINKAQEFASKATLKGAAGVIAKNLPIVGPLFRASGGAVNPNSPYIVGENGPELFTPSTYGQITRNSALGSGGGITVNVFGDVSGTELVDKVKRGIMNELKMNAQV